MDNNEIEDIRFGQYSQGHEMELPKEFIDDCLDIMESVESNSKCNDVINWLEREKMDKASRRSAGMFFDSESSAETLSYLKEEDAHGEIKGDMSEAKPSNDKEASLMAGLADFIDAMSGKEIINEDGKNVKN